MNDPIGRNVLITGASRGIGAALALRIAAAGRRLLLVARSGDRLEALCREVERRGGHAEHAEIDLAGTEAGRRAARVARDRLGDIDTAVLVAGTSHRGALVDVPLEALEREAQVNYLAPLAIVRELLPAMIDRGAGSIVLVGSLAGGPLPFPTNAGYSASKAALLALVRSVRPELEGSGVHLGIVLPGSTETGMNPKASGFLPTSTPEHVADVIVEAIERREGVKTPGFGNRVLARLARLFPGPLERALAATGSLLLPGE